MNNQVSAKDGEKDEDDEEERDWDITDENDKQWDVYNHGNFWKVSNNQHDLHSLMQDL